MMDLATLLTFAAAAFALALTPGPDMLLVMTRSVAQGRVAGLVTLAGITVGCYGHALVAGFSLSGVLLIAPVMFEAIRWAGAAYLLYLGVQAFRGAGGFQPPSANAPRLPLWSLFRQGLLTNLLNPKVALFFLALMPQFISAQSSSKVLAFVALGVSFIVLGLVWCLTLALGAARLRAALLRRPSMATLLNRIAGTLFIALGLRLATARP